MDFAQLPQDPEAWVSALGAVEIPVLERSLAELDRLRENEDRLTARDIARVLLHDPMFTLRVLRHVQGLRGAGQTCDISTLEHALMMLGVTPFFERFGVLPTVEVKLESSPQALRGLRRVLSRAHHAALNARDWAELRRDTAANEIAVAALLHDLAEMLLWCHAPESALRIQEMQRVDPALRSSAAQRTVLGFRLTDLQGALVEQWKLGDLLRSLMAERGAAHARANNVLLAVDLARHSVNGWDNPALPHDYAAIGQLLKLKHEEVLQIVERTARQELLARDWYFPGGTGATGPIQDSAIGDDI